MLGEDAMVLMGGRVQGRSGGRAREEKGRTRRKRKDAGKGFHVVIGLNYGRTIGLSRPEAGEVEHWESILASDAATGGLTMDDPDLQ